MLALGGAEVEGPIGPEPLLGQQFGGRSASVEVPVGAEDAHARMTGVRDGVDATGLGPALGGRGIRAAKRGAAAFDDDGRAGAAVAPDRQRLTVRFVHRDQAQGVPGLQSGGAAGDSLEGRLDAIVGVIAARAIHDVGLRIGDGGEQRGEDDRDGKRGGTSHRAPPNRQGC